MISLTCTISQSIKSIFSLVLQIAYGSKIFIYMILNACILLKGQKMLFLEGNNFLCYTVKKYSLVQRQAKRNRPRCDCGNDICTFHCIFFRVCRCYVFLSLSKRWSVCNIWKQCILYYTGLEKRHSS